MTRLLLTSLVALLAACGPLPVSPSAETDWTDALIGWGQSGMAGAEIDHGAANAPPPGIPDDRVRYLRRNLVGLEAIHDDEFRSLRVTTLGNVIYHGPELALALGVARASPRVAYLKITANGSAITDWLEGGKYADALGTALADFRSGLDGPVRFHLVTWQGTNEAKAQTEAPALAWARNAAVLISNIEGAVDQELHPIHVLDSLTLPNAPWVATVNDQKRIAAEAAGGSVVDIERIYAASGRVQSDGTHVTGLGSNDVGELAAAQVVSTLQ